MKKFQSKKIAKGKKYRLTDGHCTRLLTVFDLMELCGFSKSHAYKVINGQAQLTSQMEELLKLKVLRSIPDWPSGWYIDNGNISAPNGFLFDPNLLENYSFLMSIMRGIHADMRELLKENKQLKKEIENRTHIRVYHNDETKPARHISLVK